MKLDRLSIAIAVAAALALPLAFDPASARPFVGPKLALALALGALAPAALVASSGIVRLRRAALVAFGAHFAALAIATSLSLVPAVSFAGDYARGMGFLARAALLGLGLAAASAVAERPDRALLVLRAMAAAAVIVALYAIVQALGLDPIFEPSLLEQVNRAGVTELRVVSTVGHANFVGAALVVGTGAALALAGAERRPALRRVAAAAGLIAAAGVVASGSRGAWLALGVQLVVVAALAPFAVGRVVLDRRHVVPAALTLVAVVAAGAALARGPIGEQVALRVQAFRTDAMTGSSRTLLWRDALPMVGRYAAHGCGPDTFALAFLPYTSVELERNEPYALYDSAHDVLLDAAIAWGLPGAATLVALWIVAGASLVRVARSTERGAARLVPVGIAVGLVGVLVAGVFVFDTMATALGEALLVGLAVGLDARGDERAPARWRAVVAAVLALAALALAWPRALLLLRADRQMAAAFASGEALAPSIANARAAVANGEALGPSPELRHLLARVYARTGDAARPPSDDERALLEQGIAELDRALATSTTPQLVLAERADLHLRLAEIEPALADLRAAVERAPAFWAGRARLARVLLESGDVDGARREARVALEWNPESREAGAVLADAEHRP